jgi:hypothetical protein
MTSKTPVFPNVIGVGSSNTAVASCPFHLKLKGIARFAKHVKSLVSNVWISFIRDILR